MTAQELLLYEVDIMGRQFKAVLAGMPEPAQCDKVSADGMSPTQMLEHLCEAYEAFVAESKGEKYEWGSFSLKDKAWGHLEKTFWDLRDKARAALAASSDDETLKRGFDYVAGHDSYHVGQLCLVRIRHDSAWDPHSLYA